ncbi:MAG: hypothetical protein E7620_08310 [Ruminococcaceae bacterium]|nr:hypothetical protein [Oscillospiraceae bacterium]
MKQSDESRVNRLSEQLGKVSEALLAEAISCDSAEALEKLQGKKRHRGVRAAVIAAAILLLTASLALMLPLHRADREEEFAPASGASASAPSAPSLPGVEDSVVLDSLDKVNYYAALKILRNSPQSASDPLSLTLPLANDESEDSANESREETPEPPKGGIGMHDIAFEQMRITKALYFTIQVTESDTFLFERVGSGKVEVVATDLSIGINPYAMITFRNGERYFSCLSEMYDLESGLNYFQTHLYISGFSFCKDTTNGVSTFVLRCDLEKQTVSSLTWVPYHNIPTEAPRYPIEVHKESVRMAELNYTFTLWELDQYYNGEKETNAPTPSDTPAENNSSEAPNTAVPTYPVETMPVEWGTLPAE